MNGSSSHELPFGRGETDVRGSDKFVLEMKRTFALGTNFHQFICKETGRSQKPVRFSGLVSQKYSLREPLALPLSLRLPISIDNQEAFHNEFVSTSSFH